MNPYIAFLKARHVLDVELLKLTAEERELLEVIAVCAHQDKPLTVTQAMRLNHLASPATLHRRLDQLQDAKLIELRYPENNRRTKYVMPTTKAVGYFNKAATAMKGTA